jgi:LytS/YehU family sensor histidine kinase
MHPAELEFLVPMFASLGFFALIAWIVFVFVDGKRRREQLKATSEFNARILEKMGSTAEFGAFLETDGGKRFMKTITIEGPSAKTRMLGSTQTGIVSASIGIAMLILGGIFYYLRDGLWVIGGILTACGIGFIASTLASYRLSKTLGLLDGDGDASQR